MTRDLAVFQDVAPNLANVSQRLENKRAGRIARREETREHRTEFYQANSHYGVDAGIVLTNEYVPDVGESAHYGAAIGTSFHRGAAQSGQVLGTITTHDSDYQPVPRHLHSILAYVDAGRLAGPLGARVSADHQSAYAISRVYGEVTAGVGERVYISGGGGVGGEMTPSGMRAFPCVSLAIAAIAGMDPTDLKRASTSLGIDYGRFALGAEVFDRRELLVSPRVTGTLTCSPELPGQFVESCAALLTLGANVGTKAR